MAGRVLRIHESNPHVNLIQCEKTKYPFTREASAQMQYVQYGDTWRSIRPNTKKIISVSGRAIIAIANTDVRLPDVLQKNIKNVPLNFNNIKES
jgi:hypothetical protein